MPSIVTLANSHGTFTTDPFTLEQAITKYLPASVNDMHELMSELAPDLDYSDVHHISELLIILASEFKDLVHDFSAKPKWKRTQDVHRANGGRGEAQFPAKRNLDH
jgi:hypothetical protein